MRVCPCNTCCENQGGSSVDFHSSLTLVGFIILPVTATDLQNSLIHEEDILQEGVKMSLECHLDEGESLSLQ